MIKNMDYSKYTLEELTTEEKKLDSQKTFTAVFIGLLVGCAIYSATHKGFFLPVLLLIVSFIIGKRHSQNLKSIQAEISRRNTIL
jgi:uncharacterized membrane protein